MRIACSLLLFALIAACPREGTTPVESGPSSQPALPAGHDAPKQPKEPAEHEGEKTGAKLDRDQVDADGVVRRGAKLSDLTPISISEAIAKADIDGKLVKLTGKVDSVCQAQGCWMVLAGDKPEQQVRITSKGHDIFVPRAAAGLMATVEGEFKLKVLPVATAQHFEDERELKAGEARKVFTEDQKEFSVTVVGLELKPAS